MPIELQRLLLRGSPLWFDRRGSVAVVFAALLPALIGFAGLGAEVGIWYTIKRQNQAAADEGALSGALEIAEGKTDYQATAACQIWRNGFDNSLGSCPTDPSQFSGDWEAQVTKLTSTSYCPSTGVEVILDQNANGLFSSLFIKGAVIDTKAIACVIDEGSACDLALDPTTTKAVDIAGNTTVNLDCGIAANSTSATAVNIQGNAKLCTTAVSSSGNINYNGNPPTQDYTGATCPNPNGAPPLPTFLFSAPVSDPYSGITYTYPIPTCMNAPTAGGTLPTTPVTLSAGIYCGPMDFKSGYFTLGGGVYYIEGEDNSKGAAFYVENGATVTGSNVTIVATSSNDKTSDGGGMYIDGAATLTAPTSAPGGLTCPNTGNEPSCSGLLFYQDPAFADTKKNMGATITAGASANLTGAIITPATNVSYTGNSGSSCTLIVSDTIQFTGNSTMTTTGCASAGVSTPQIYTVALGG